ncbi:integral peroxisomal membrane peroxin-domain-containing protein [Powellomyces hirtus]|nr:integral peroxisomal membrane peroxin-domain-containing protein [Powellomyces hirtus]
MATIDTPPPSPKPAQLQKKVMVSSGGAPKPRPVPIAHDITSLLLSLQGLFQRLSPYISPAVHWLTFILTWQNKYLSACVVAAYCGIVFLGWEAAVHLPFMAGVVGLGYLYAKRLGRGVGTPQVNPPPPTIPHLLHTLISVSSHLHSLADALDSFASLVTFTRKSETASLAFFRAVIVLYACIAATIFCIGLRAVLMIVGVVGLCWGSDFAQLAKGVAFIKVQEISKQLGMDVQWVDEDEDEDVDDKKSAIAEQEKAEALRRGSEVAARQLMGVPKVGTRPKPSAANAKGAPVKKAVKAGPKAVPGAPKPLVVKKPVAALPVLAETAAPQVTPTTAELSVVPPGKKVVESAKSTSSPVAATSAEVQESSDKQSAQSEQDQHLALLASAPPKTGPTGPIPDAPGPEINRPTSATSSGSSPEDQDRVQSRLAQVVRQPSQPSPPPTTELPPNERDIVAAELDEPDESNVSVDMHPDWALPTGEDDDEITDDFRKALAGSLLRNGKLAPLTSIGEGEPLETDYMKIELDQATDAFHRQMIKEEEEEENSVLDPNHYLRRRRSTDSDLTIDALASFSDPRRSSYNTSGAQNFSNLNRKSRTMSNASTSTRSTLSSETTTTTTSSVAGPAGRARTMSDVDANLMRQYSITDPVPPVSAINTSPSPQGSSSHSPLSPSSSMHSSRSSIRGSNRKPLNVVLSFETYENQRWWVGVGWVPHLLPTERGAWTDVAGSRNMPKSSFDLPEFRREQLEQMNQKADDDANKKPAILPIPDLPLDMSSHRYAWDWDGPWHIDMYGSSTGTTDDDGWEYGDNFWSGWKKRKTLKRVVRRRRWVRLARLYEVGRKRSVTFGGSFVFEKQDQFVGMEGGEYRQSLQQRYSPDQREWPEIDQSDIASFDDSQYDPNSGSYDNYPQHYNNNSSPMDEYDDEDDGTRIEYPDEDDGNGGEGLYAQDNYTTQQYRPQQQQQQQQYNHYQPPHQPYYDDEEEQYHRSLTASPEESSHHPRRRDTAPAHHSPRRTSEPQRPNMNRVTSM